MSTELLDVIALSPLQRGLYSVSNTSRGIDPYLVTFAVRVEQLTDPSTLRTAFDQLLQRYPQLGASVVSDDLPHPVLVLTTAGRIGWHEVDLRRTEDPLAAARRIYADEGRRRMNLDTGPLFRVTAARVAEHDYELICTAHHLVVDGWSVPLMFADLMALHRGAGATLPTPPPLRDHAAWLAAKDDATAQRAWRTALADLAPMPMIVPPADPDLPVVGEARFGRPETDAVTAWARARGLTLNTLLQLTWARILSGLVGRDDVVFGQTTSGRDATLPGAEHLVGALVATIPVRVRVDERAPATVAAQLQRQVAQLRTHEYLGMAEITRLAGAGQLFDTLLVFENVPVGAMTGAMELGHGARLIARRIDSPSHYPLTMVPIVEHGELVSRVEIRPDLISRFDPDRLAHRMLVVLRRLLTADRYCDVDILLDDESPSLEASVLAAQPISDPARRSGHPRALSGAADVPGAVGAEAPGPGGLASTPDVGGAVATSDPAGDRGVDPGDHAHGPVALSVAGGTAATTDAPGVQAAGPGPRASAPDAVADLDRSVAQTLGSGGDFSVPGVSVAAGGAVAATDVAGAEVVGSDDHANAPEALLAAADAAGDAVAVIDTAGAQTFAEFGSAVRALAANLRALGLPPGGAVAVVLPRDRRVLHAPFAIGLAGGVCVHVDPATPVDRLAYLLETAQVRVVLGDAAPASALAAVRASGVEVLHAIPDGDGGLQVDAELLTYTGSAVAVPSAESPFYVIFTSGTTGRPKGVAVPHRALLNHSANHRRRIFEPVAARLGRTLRVGHGWSTGFDAAWQPTVALLSGHTVVLLADAVRTDAEQIVAAIARHGIDIFDTSPSMLARLIAAGLFIERDGREHCPLAVLALGGEAISQDTWTRLRGLADTRVINFYGPTETTVEALMAEVDDHPAPTIGRPFDAMAAEVLDHRLRPVPPGGQGELYLSGAQLAIGYLGRPAATAAAFVAGPRGRRYRTGDLVRRTLADTVIYEGRIDSQVKINGYRVEPDEATVVLRELDGVRHAAALAFADNGRTRLGALVVADRTVADIRAALARRLPQFLIPSRIVLVDEIPLNRNDKLDVHAATALLTRPVAEGAAVAPATDTERMLLGLIEAMGEPDADPRRIGMLDSLIDLGLDSIGVIDLVSRLRGADYRITARDVLAAGDLRELATRLDDLGLDDAADTAEPTPAGTVLPLSVLAQEILEHGDFRYLAQSQILSLPPEATVETVAERLRALALAHPALRSRLSTAADGTPVLVVEEPERAEPLIAAADSADPAGLLAETVERLDPAAGRMVSAALVEKADGTPGQLLLSIHHLAVDVVSWLILGDDLRRMAEGRSPINETASEAITVRKPAGSLPILGTPLGARLTDPTVDRATGTLARVVELGPERTRHLLRRCTETEVPLEDLLLLTCARVVADTADGTGRVAVTRESHGRSSDDDSRRVGWFTVEETVSVPLAATEGWTPEAGRPPLTDRTVAARGQLRLNHLGRFDLLEFGSGPWSPVPIADFADEFGLTAHPQVPLRFSIDVSTAVVPRESGPSLVARFDVNGAVLDAAQAEARVARWSELLADFADRAVVAGR